LSDNGVIEPVNLVRDANDAKGTILKELCTDKVYFGSLSDRYSLNRVVVHNNVSSRDAHAEIQANLIIVHVNGQPVQITHNNMRILPTIFIPIAPHQVALGL
jgi:hypothetical protein